jgi:hypothetical protein
MQITVHIPYVTHDSSLNGKVAALLNLFESHENEDHGFLKLSQGFQDLSKLARYQRKLRIASLANAYSGIMLRMSKTEFVDISMVMDAAVAFLQSVRA